KRAWWEQAANRRTTFYGSGQSGGIETTALAALAFLQANDYSGTTRAALTWLTEQKDASGTWHSTQATVLALKALIAGTGRNLAEDKERHITINLGDNLKREIVISADQGDVMKQIDLSAYLKPGSEKLTIQESTGTAAGYQVGFWYHTPDKEPGARREPL